MKSEANIAEGADWKRISFFAASGLGLTIFAAFLKGSYIQSVVINLGTTLFLFGYLWVAERQLTKRIDALSEPRTLSEAQMRVREVLTAFPTRTAHIETYDQKIGTCLAATGSKIMQAGFAQRRPNTAGASVELYDQSTMSITWLLQHTGETLRHCITFPDGTAVAAEPVDVRLQLSAEDLRAALYRFEDQVFDGLLIIIKRIGPDKSLTYADHFGQD